MADLARERTRWVRFAVSGIGAVKYYGRYGAMHSFVQQIFVGAVQVGTDVKDDVDADSDVLIPFSIQVYSRDGSCLSRFMLTLYDDDGCSLSAAERQARVNLSDNHGEPLVIVVTEDPSTTLRNLQLRMIAPNPTAHEVICDRPTADMVVSC